MARQLHTCPFCSIDCHAHKGRLQVHKNSDGKQCPGSGCEVNRSTGRVVTAVHGDRG